MFKDPNNPALKAARMLLRSGFITTAEMAALAGVSRQHMHRVTNDLEPVRRRKAYLKQLWRQALDAEEA